MTTLLRFTLVAGLLAAGPTFAKVSADEAAKLGKSLTPVGATAAASADGSIPAWEGGLTNFGRLVTGQATSAQTQTETQKLALSTQH